MWRVDGPNSGVGKNNYVPNTYRVITETRSRNNKKYLPWSFDLNSPRAASLTESIEVSHSSREMNLSSPPRDCGDLPKTDFLPLPPTCIFNEPVIKIRSRRKEMKNAVLITRSDVKLCPHCAPLTKECTSRGRTGNPPSRGGGQARRKLEQRRHRENMQKDLFSPCSFIFNKHDRRPGGFSPTVNYY